MSGKIFPIGGNLELVPYNPIIKKISELLDDETLVIIPSASSNPVSSAKKYSFIFNTLGINTKAIYGKKRGCFNEKKTLKVLESAAGVFFTGGNQMRLTSLLGGTETAIYISERFADDDNFLIVGTSAGAAALPDTMIAYGEAENALLKGAVQLAPGLGFLENIIIDTHFIERNRIWRILHVVAENPGTIGIGLGENTGMLIEKGTGTIIGAGSVVIVEGSEINYTNIPDIEEGKPFTVKGIKVNILTHGFKYALFQKNTFSK